MPLDDRKIESLGEKLQGSIPEIAFAYIFGSSVKVTVKKNSDIDIAVYLLPETKTIEVVGRILGAVEEVLPGEQIDLVILNDAGAIISMEVLKGRLLFVRNHLRNLHAGYYSLTCRMAEDQMAWMKKQLKYRGHEVQWSD
jgi:predicted nucleotidyltransferase